LHYKIERNAIVRLIKLRKKKYLENMIDFNKDIWGTLKELIKRKSDSGREKEDVDFGNSDSTITCNIADRFNSFYV